MHYPNCVSPQIPFTLVEGLNMYLANLNVMYIKLHNLHWNVVGVGFFDLHTKTQELYDAIAEKSDEVAERIKALGCLPLASMQEYLQAATIPELPTQPIATSDVPQIIIADFQQTLDLLRNIEVLLRDSNDQCTIGLIAEAMCFFEKNIWMMHAYLGRS